MQHHEYKTMKLYELIYKESIEQDYWATISTHFSKFGALGALRVHKEEETNKVVSFMNELKKTNPQGFFQPMINGMWDVREIEVQP